MTKQIPLRERKKGILRLQILDTLLDLLKDKSFDRIKVKEICERVNISEVTFFKYFAKKEDLLLFYMLVWNYKREARIIKEGREKGLAGIYALFKDTWSTDNSLTILISFIGFISRLEAQPQSIILEEYEKRLLTNDDIIQPLSLDNQIKLHLKEAVDEKVLSSDREITKIHLLLSTTYYGTPLVAHMTGQPIDELYRNNLDKIFEITKESRK